MKSILQAILVANAAFAMGAGCGGRNGGRSNGDDLGGDADPGFCISGTECRSGICEGGRCVDATACDNHGECGAAQYCHFPSAPIPWDGGKACTNNDQCALNRCEGGKCVVEGACSGACSNDDSCGIIGQMCHAYLGFKRCYTNIDCNPANNSQDCPPGEVCWQDSRSCKWPPDQCYFPEQCPYGWVCDIDSGDCVDPDALGDCINDAACIGKPGCETGCTCFDGVCQITNTCQPTPAGDISCGAGNYCAGGVCQPATACPQGQATCTPYGLVCTNGYCGNAEPCGGTAPNYTCPANFECKTNYTPPACFPAGTSACSRDDQCAAGKFCDLFSGTCKDGCRNDTECVGKCGTSPTCYCKNVENPPGTWTRACSPDAGPGPGNPCTTNDQCMGGYVCAPTDPGLGALAACMVSCPTECRQSCDVLVSQILPTCPNGQQCGSGSLFEDLLGDALFELMGITGGGNGSVCYPNP